MNSSILNPEAPEFYPHFETTAEGGYKKVTKTIYSSNSMPSSTSYEVFKTFTDFNIISYKFSNNVVEQSNQILTNELPDIRLKINDNEYNTEKIADANDSMLDRVNINLDTSSGVNKPNDEFLQGVESKTNLTGNNSPSIMKIQMGSTLFIAAKNILRPQLNFKDPIDNSENLWVPKISDKPNNIKPLALNILYNEEGEAVGYEHPYKVELDCYHPPSGLMDPDDTLPQLPRSLEEVKPKYISTEQQLDSLVDHLTTVKEIAVDLEHHSYRTYQGITCLIQITTNEGGDFIIDALAVREYLYKLNLAFTNPKILKILHGADNDIIWLQRDFGVYMVGLFDTHQAAKILKFNALSLKSLLMRYCKVNVDKKYQLADWRIRPLPEELIKYAQSDTHYLIYIWRMMKRELLDMGDGKPQLLLDAFDQSKQLCGNTFNKEVINESSHMPLYIRSRKSFNTQQMAALKMLYKWRDLQARQLDESTTYLLPNHMLLALAESLPREVQGVTACCSPMPPFVKQNLIVIHRMILSCRELPMESQLYQMPNSIHSMVTHHMPILCYEVHDFSQAVDFSEEPLINLDFTAQFYPAQTNFHPDIEVFYPENTIHIKSNLNVNAKMFIPPFDRYRKYRSLAQVEEIKEFKEKEAKIALLSKDNPIIKEEVLEKLQKAQTHKANEESRNVVEASTPIEDSTNNSNRKRKLSGEKDSHDKKNTVDDTVVEPDVCKNESLNAKDSKPYQYKNFDYKTFYDDSDKAMHHKKPKKKFKQHKK